MLINSHKATKQLEARLDEVLEHKAPLSDPQRDLILRIGIAMQMDDPQLRQEALEHLATIAGQLSDLNASLQELDRLRVKIAHFAYFPRSYIKMSF